MLDHARLLADLRAAAAIEQSDWPQADKARNARDVLARHGPALIELVEREDLKREQHANVVRGVEAIMAKLTREHPLYVELCAALYVPVPQRPLTDAEMAHALSLLDSDKEAT